MIKVNYLDDESLKKWYFSWAENNISSKMDSYNKKYKEIESSTIEKNIKKCIEYYYDNVLKINSEMLWDILFTRIEYLISKYDWIRDYCKMAEGEEKSDESENVLKKTNAFFIEIFNYKRMRSQIGQELYEKMNIRVCPYCNRQYIHAVDIREKNKRLGDLDHILPQDSYTLFSLSLWNLIPCCKPCNMIFKRNSKSDILSPINRGFDDECIFKIDYHDLGAIIGDNQNFDVHWENRAIGELGNNIQNNINIFKLNELYQNSKREIGLTLQRRYRYSRCYKKYSSNTFDDWYDIRLLYGVSLNPDNYNQELLGKAIHDIIFYN